jgi:hypothetical protein
VKSYFHHPFIPLCGISFETQSTQRIPIFSFSAEMAENENHPKLRFIWFNYHVICLAVTSIINWFLAQPDLQFYRPKGLGLFLFGVSAKRNKKKPSVNSACPAIAGPLQVGKRRRVTRATLP